MNLIKDYSNLKKKEHSQETRTEIMVTNYPVNRKDKELMRIHNKNNNKMNKNNQVSNCRMNKTRMIAIVIFDSSIYQLFYTIILNLKDILIKNIILIVIVNRSIG